MTTVPKNSAAKTLGAAVVGLGVGRQHALAYAKIPGCSLRRVSDLDAERVRNTLAEIGQGTAAQNFEEIVGDSGVDIVSIASFDDDHAAQVLLALGAGKHVFAEKPLCLSLEELKGVKRAWESARGRHLQSNLVLRSAPLYRWLKEAIRSGELGDIYAFDGDYLYGRLHKITEGWRNHVDDYSVLQGGGVHLVDLMMWTTGQKPSKVTALGNKICSAGSKFRYDDYVAATYEFPSGMIGRITANFGCQHRHQHVVRVFGTKATFLYDDAGARLHETRDPDAAPRKIDLSPLPGTKGDLIPDFVAGILNGSDPAPAACHEFDVMSACAAADRSRMKGQSITVEYL